MSPLLLGLIVRRLLLPSVTSLNTIWIVSPTLRSVVSGDSLAKVGNIMVQMPINRFGIGVKTAQKGQISYVWSGRGGENRTLDLLLPKQEVPRLANLATNWPTLRADSLVLVGLCANDGKTLASNRCGVISIRMMFNMCINKTVDQPYKSYSQDWTSVPRLLKKNHISV